MSMRHRIVCLLSTVGMIATLGGCFGTSPGARFYTLSPQETRGISAAQGVDVLVRVGPVSIPSYLDRRQIVTRNGRNGIDIAEYERWAGNLDDEIIRLLVNVLSERLSASGISVVPWRSINLADAATVYRIPFSIVRIDGIPGEIVVLNANWALIKNTGKQEQILIARESMITETVGGKGYDALVAAMGKAVERLAGEMGNAVESARSSIPPPSVRPPGGGTQQIVPGRTN